MKHIKYVLSLAALLLAFIIVCRAPAQPAVEALPEEAPSRETMLSLIRKGGPVMFPLGICSLLGLALAVERFISLSRKRIIPPGLMDELRARMRDGADGAAEAIRVCDRSRTPAGRVFKSGLECLPMGPEAVEDAIEDAGGREADKLKRSLRGLSVIGSISPLLGLLGTVYGLINVFQTASLGGMGKADLLAKGIYEALVTTAAGLTIAIPVVLVYQYLNTKVDGLVDEMDEMGLVFMSSCVRGREAEAGQAGQ